MGKLLSLYNLKTLANIGPSSSGDEGNRVKMKNPIKQSITTGIQQTQDFLRNAIGDKKPPNAGHHAIPPSHQSHPYSSSGQLGFVTLPTQIPPNGPFYGAPIYPTAPPPSSFNPLGGGVPAGPPHHSHQPGGFATAASTALAAGATAAVAPKILPKGKSKKLLKYGAAAGAAGLAGYALTKAFRHKSSSSSSSSDSD